MRTEPTEYFGETHHEEPRPKAFKIEKAQDPDLQKILRARMDALTDPELRDGSRALFCLLLDLSLNPQTMDCRRRGQVCISTQQLCERLARSKRAIYGWTIELIVQRHIWVSKKGRPNTNPINVYHICGLQPKREDVPELAGDGLWGNGYRRPGQTMPAGARRGLGTKRHCLVDARGNPLFSQVPQNEPTSRTFCGSLPQVMREAPAQKDTGLPQVMRETSARNDTSLPQVMREAPAQNGTVQQHKTAPFIESPDVRSSDQETLLNVQRLNALSVTPGFRKKSTENGFLLDVVQTMALWDKAWAQKEMTNSGAWWRLKFRENPDKANRVLAEVGRMIKERVQFTENPGAAAADLWRRFA